MPTLSRAARRRVLPACLLLALVVIGWWLLRTRTVVDTTAIARGDIEVSVTALGTLQPQSYVDVGAQASGEIRHIAVQPGSVVKKGDLLVEIDPSVQQAKVDADRAALDSLSAQLDAGEASAVFARQQNDRQRQMNADSSTRAEDVQSAESTARSAVAHVADLRAQIEGASSTLKGDQAQLGYTRIFAPMSGTVITLDAREGQTLNATYQTPKILRVADLSTMTVWTEVSEADVRRVHPGMPVYFTTLGDERRWTGTVRQILPAPPNPSPDASSSSSSDSQKGGSTSGAGKVVLYTVLFDVRNTDHALMPQMSAQVFFVEAAAHHTTLAPLAALQPVAGKSNVYTAKVETPDGDVVTREVHTGVQDRIQAQVLSGLAPGERLVTGVRQERALAGRFQW
jgi:membrane fusion protein, macrolide-specific efflux system